MEVKEAMVARRSIRAFRPAPVSQEILHEIMERALWAPSWGNTQPWKFTIVGGETLEKIRDDYVQMFNRGVPAEPDFPMPNVGEFNETEKARYQGLGRDLFEELCIARGDKEKRNAYHQHMMRFAGAPHVIYLHLDKGFHPYALMDSGIILQTIALLAVDQGLGTCFLALTVRYPDVVKKHTNLPDDQMLVMGMAIGRPILDYAANRFRRQRGEASVFLRFVDLA